MDIFTTKRQNGFDQIFPPNSGKEAEKEPKKRDYRRNRFKFAAFDHKYFCDLFQKQSDKNYISLSFNLNLPLQVLDITPDSQAGILSFTPTAAQSPADNIDTPTHGLWRRPLPVYRSEEAGIWLEKGLPLHHIVH